MAHCDRIAPFYAKIDALLSGDSKPRGNGSMGGMRNGLLDGLSGGRTDGSTPGTQANAIPNVHKSSENGDS